MREIIFRGKRIENNEWVYGDLIQLGQSADYWYIMPIGVSGEMYEDEPYPFRENDVMCRCALSKVNPSTVCQYTGLKDKNGNTIFEGDIVKYYQDKNRLNYGIIEYKNCYFGIKPITKSLPQLIDIAMKWHNGEVIGNIHDNPELLK